MHMRADDLSAPSGTTFKFDKIGDALEGTISYVSEWEAGTNKFTGAEEETMRVGVDTGNGEVMYVWPRKGSAMARALGDALREAKLDELTAGQKLKLAYTEDRDTGKPQPMKVYRARISAAVPADTEPPF
jgi:hypothetical protein